VCTAAWQQHDVQELCRAMFDALELTWQNTEQSNVINELYEGKMKDCVQCLEVLKQSLGSLLLFNILCSLTKQPKLTAIIQSRRLTLFGHIMRMDDNADAKRILLASPLADWRRQLGRPRITWLSTVQQDLKQHHLTLPEAAD